MIQAELQTVFGRKTAQYNPDTELFHTSDGRSFGWNYVIHVIAGNIQRP